MPPGTSAGTESKALIIKAKGGLGNRMLSAITGVVLARLNDRAPLIDWRDGMYVPAGENLYPLLFDASWMDDLDQFDDAADVAPKVWSNRMTLHPTDVIHREYPNQHQDPFIYRKLSIDLAGPDPDNRVAVFWSYLPKLKRLQQRIAKDPEFSGRPLDDVTSGLLDVYFKPVDEITQAVDEVFTAMSGPVIGVHIRFTDRKAPLPKIVAKLEKLKERNPDATIFLATDSQEAQDAVCSRFSDTVSISKSLATDGGALHVTANAFEDPVVEARNAVIDMIALSRCDWLVHSSHSTFSVTAALIGRIPKSRQIDVDRFNAKVRLKQFIQARA